MRVITKASFKPALARALLLEATLAAALSAAALTIPPGGLVATQSGHDLILSFSTTSPDLYTVQTSPDMQQPWTSLPSGTAGDGTVKSVTLTNGVLGNQGFYRLLMQTPADLLLPQSTATAILGYWCGGIKERVHVTGFDPTSGYPVGIVYLSR